MSNDIYFVTFCPSHSLLLHQWMVMQQKIKPLTFVNAVEKLKKIVKIVKEKHVQSLENVYRNHGKLLPHVQFPIHWYYRRTEG